MKTFPVLIAYFLIAFASAFGALPESGTVSVDSSVTGRIIVFSGSPLLTEEYEGSFDLDVEMNHNPVTGQVTGSANVTLSDLSAFFSEEELDGAVVSNFKGLVEFSAKPVRAGSITRLVGAKVSEKVSVKLTEGKDYLNVTISGVLSFKRYEIDTAPSPPRFNALTNKSNIKLNMSGMYQGKRASQSETIPVPEIAISSDYLADNFADVAVVLQNVKTTSKGAVSGAADCVLDSQTPESSAYKVSGKRDAKTGTSQITLTGQKRGFKGSTAILNVDDSLNIQTGRKLKNTIKAYGYSIAF